MGGPPAEGAALRWWRNPRRNFTNFAVAKGLPETGIIAFTVSGGREAPASPRRFSMTSAKAPAAKPKPRGWFRFPDPPEIPDEKMTAFDHLSINGNAHFLEHLAGYWTIHLD